jgi:aminoglycoside phosphotransferase (APT) family kinase protein
MQTRIEKHEEQRKRLRERLPVLSSSDFMARHVRPLLNETGPHASCNVEMVRNWAPTRMTVRYAFDNGVTAYGKVYTGKSGPAGYAALQRLWLDGFGPGSADRVPEPLGFCAEENLVLMRAAAGVPIDTLLLHEPLDRVLPAVHAAGRWLARLHSSKSEGLPRDPACNRVKVFELADRLGKAAASHPADLGLLLDLLQRLRSLAPADGVVLVSTHGQYSPANVFVDGSDVTVIDVDRLSLSDPAKDVAMFLFSAASLRAKASGPASEAERIGREFVDAYREHSGRPLENLSYYTALLSLNRFAKCAKDHAAADPVRRQVEAFYLGHFERSFPAKAVLQPNYALQHADYRPSTGDSLAGIVAQFLSPDLPLRGADSPAAAECKATLVQDVGTGRVTMRYQIDGATVVFAKRYIDGLGAHSYQVQRTFWDNGFGTDSRYRVPEPLAFLPEKNLFLMREGPGAPLTRLLGDGTGDWKAGVREAARWLAAFHRSAVRVGDPEPEWDSLKTFRLATRLVKAAAAQPSKRALLLDVMQLLKERLMDLPEGRPVVQTHGRFHHDHVFLTSESVTVIDLDRSRPTDPAKDVAEFVRVLRLAAFRAGVDQRLTDKVTDAFLGQYLGLVPDAAAGLPHYWLSFLVLSYLGHLRKALPDGRSAALTAFHEREIRRVSVMRT